MGSQDPMAEGLWHHERISTWARGHVGVVAHAPISAQAHGRTGVWTFGFLGTCAHGHISPQVRPFCHPTHRLGRLFPPFARAGACTAFVSRPRSSRWKEEPHRRAVGVRRRSGVRSPRAYTGCSSPRRTVTSSRGGDYAIGCGFRPERERPACDSGGRRAHPPPPVIRRGFVEVVGGRSGRPGARRGHPRDLAGFRCGIDLRGRKARRRCREPRPDALGSAPQAARDPPVGLWCETPRNLSAPRHQSCPDRRHRPMTCPVARGRINTNADRIDRNRRKSVGVQ